MDAQLLRFVRDSSPACLRTEYASRTRTSTRASRTNSKSPLRRVQQPSCRHFDKSQTWRRCRASLGHRWQCLTLIQDTVSTARSCNFSCPCSFLHIGRIFHRRCSCIRLQRPRRRRMVSNVDHESPALTFSGSPGGIGFDINCGVRLLRTNLTEAEVSKKIKRLTDVRRFALRFRFYRHRCLFCVGSVRASSSRNRR